MTKINKLTLPTSSPCPGPGWNIETGNVEFNVWRREAPFMLEESINQPEPRKLANLDHIDTCLSCYLTDHHNRPGELLLGVPVDGKTRNWQVKEGLRDEFNSLASDLDVPEDLDFDKVLDECFARRNGRMVCANCGNRLDFPVNFCPVCGRADPFQRDRDGLKTFDKSLEVNGPDDWDEPCCAWFLLTWDVEDTEDAHASL